MCDPEPSQSPLYVRKLLPGQQATAYPLACFVCVYLHLTRYPQTHRARQGYDGGGEQGVFPQRYAESIASRATATSNKHPAKNRYLYRLQLRVLGGIASRKPNKMEGILAVHQEVSPQASRHLQVRSEAEHEMFLEYPQWLTCFAAFCADGSKLQPVLLL